MQSISDLQKKFHYEIGTLEYRFDLKGEMGYRLAQSYARIQEQSPFSREYILAQISHQRGLWSNFQKFHGDICGRWLLAMANADHDEDSTKALLSFVDEIMALQDEHGRFGVFEGEKMHRQGAYGNAWMLRGLVEIARRLNHGAALEAAKKLAQHYIDTATLWETEQEGERSSGFYATTDSCFYHALDGVMELYLLSEEQEHLDLAKRMSAHLVGAEEADHAHMYLSTRRGLLKLMVLEGDAEGIQALSAELWSVYSQNGLETGGMPERLWLEEEGRDDEACALFDWLLLCMAMYEQTNERRWLEVAILNLENQIFYNQCYNGGFGSAEIGERYKQSVKEAPWCCSLYGPYALQWFCQQSHRLKGDQLQVLHPMSGSFMSKQGDHIELSFGEDRTELEIKVIKLKHLKTMNITIPSWMQIDQKWASLELNLEEGKNIVCRVDYKSWKKCEGKAPLTEGAGGSKGSYNFFLGPWMMTHRHEGPLNLGSCCEGHGAEIKHHAVRGLSFYGQSLQVQVPAQVSYEKDDTFLHVEEKDQSCCLYPLSAKESPNDSSSRFVFS